MAEPCFVVAGSRPWNRPIAEAALTGRPGRWVFVSERDELTLAELERLDPEAVFFLHWSWIVPSEIVDRWECVVFHMADVPYGRGGSPLQNLILEGRDATVLTALRMTSEIDAGPVYEKRPLSLEGTAEAIYLRATRLACEMVADWVADRPEAIDQEGEPLIFTRRTPDQSRLTGDESLDEVHDLIRMLDADGYPRAVVVVGGLRLELSRSARYDGRVEADVTITVEAEEGS
jgi:methionyl-tRNA formyltransferase